MKRMKKLSAVLLIVALLLSMLSGMAFSAMAAVGELGGPVSIEEVEVGGGIAVGGEALPALTMVVNDDWKGQKGTKAIKLDGVVYSAIMDTNAFGDLADAVAACKGNEVIYVAAGEYQNGVSVSVGGLKIYGPYAGVNPNAANIGDPNPARPAAAGGSTADEAVLLGSFGVGNTSSNLTVDGLYLGGTSGFSTVGVTYRYGTFVRNCVVASSKSPLVAYSAGNNPDFVFENNRVLSGKSLMSYAGMMNVRISNNYLNLTEKTMDLKWVTAGSMGSSVVIEGNYYKNCGGAFYFENPYQTLLYTAIVRDNYVEDMGAAPFVHNAFYSVNTLPGTSVQVTGNVVMGIDAGQTVFKFPYFSSQENPNRFRHMININENYFDIPANTKFVESDMNGVLNLAKNYYATPISVDRVTKYEDTDLILYPYYADPEMTTLAGDATFVSGMAGTTIDPENKIVTIDLGDTDLDYVDLSLALQPEEGCTWKLYEEITLENEIADKILYFDGVSTERFAAIVTADGAVSNVYTLRVLRSIGTEAELLGVIFKDAGVSDPVIEGNTFTYTFDKDLAYADYDIRVSSGATYELYKKYSQTTAPSEAFPEIGNYIPFGGFEFNVVVTAEDDPMTKKIFKVVFEREASDLYDPSVVAVKAPAMGESVLHEDRVNPGKLILTYRSDRLLTKATFDLVTTPGASYTIYADKELSVPVSSSAALKEIALADGTNTFYVKVVDGERSNVVTFVVENQKRSTDAKITAVSGLTTSIVDGKIYINGGGESINLSFDTSSPYAIVKVYADPAKTIELEYTSDPVELEPNRISDKRSFNLEIAYANSRYFVECIAEDGKTVKDYELNISKLARTNNFIDVSDDAWFASYVKIANEKSILQGSSMGGDAYIFRPDAKTTRQEMAAVAARLMGINTKAYSDVYLPFYDSAKIADWAVGSVKVVKQLGIMKGDAVNNFNPTAKITREEVMVMFARMFNLTEKADLSEFKDVAKVSAWAVDGVAATVYAGLVEGDPKGYLSPQKTITRAELAAIIARS